jgi:hypothetical protein
LKLRRMWYVVAAISTASACGEMSPVATKVVTQTHQEPLTSTPVTAQSMYCHAISAVRGGHVDKPGRATSCPTGATLFCESVPIDATSPDHAHDACTACFGEGACVQDYVAWDSSTAGASLTRFMYTTAGNGNCTAQAGDIANGWDCTSGRWAP